MRLNCALGIYRVYIMPNECILEFIEDRTEVCENNVITLVEFKNAIKSWYKYYDKGRYNIKESIKYMDSKYPTCEVYWYDCRLKPLPIRPVVIPFYLSSV